MDKQAKIEQLKQESRKLTKQGKIEEATMKFNEAYSLEHGKYNQLTIRPEIMQFAIEMEKEMARHDPEKGDSWKDMHIDMFRAGISDHLWQLKDAKYKSDNEAISHEAVDIANYAMMIWHKAKGE